MRSSPGECSTAAQPEPTVVAALWRGLDVFRPVALLYAAYSASVRQDEMARPWLAWVVLAVLAAWTASLVACRPLARLARTSRIVLIELALACCAILSTRLVDTPEVIVGGAKTLPGLWPAAAVVAWAVLRGWRAGMLAAFLVGAADLVEVGLATHSVDGIPANSATINNIVILVLLGGCIGYCADLSRDGHAALREALRVRAEVLERDRLARTVHDGVLQTLTYIHRRGTDLGGEAGELGSMAADQERQLRALVSRASGSPVLGGSVRSVADRGQVDLRSVLARYDDGAVQVISPAAPVLVAARVAVELDGAVGAALDNVRRHAGPGAQAWVLIDDTGTEVTVTIRDNGVGVPSGRLAEAALSGRMGLASSIGGRIRDLGGTTTVDSRPGEGTCLELTVSKLEPTT